MDSALVADNGTTTMVAWTSSTGTRGYVGAHWATVAGGVVTAHGDLPGDTQGGSLIRYGSDFILSTGTSLYRFTNGSWTAISGLSGPTFAFGGTNVLSVSGRSCCGPVSADVYDGSTISSSKALGGSTMALGGVAGDGAGSFGVVTVDRTNFNNPPIHFNLFDGTNWTDTLVTTETIPFSQGLNNVVVGYGAGAWAFAYTIGSNVITWVLGPSGWTSQTFNLGSPYNMLMLGNGNSLCVAGGASKAWALTYSAGTWTNTQVGGTNAGGNAYALKPYGTDGFIFLYGSGGGALYASAFDGTAWKAVQSLTNNYGAGSSPSIATSGAELAVGYSTGSGTALIGYTYRPQVSTFDGSTWSTAAPLTTVAVKSSAVGAGTAFIGGNLFAAYPTPGVMEFSERVSGTFTAPLDLPVSATLSGMVRDAALAHANNGHALSVWSQWDADTVRMYGSEFDGAAWSTPVELTADASAPSVASNGTQFVIGWMKADYTRLVAVWNGAGISTPVGLGKYNLTNNYRLPLASDGAGYVAVWDDGSSSTNRSLYASSSTDGVTWTPGALIETGTGWSFGALAGGPAGVAEWSYQSSVGVTARVFTGGTWSAASAPLTASSKPGGGLACRVATGTAEAMLACSGTGGISAQLFSQGAWASASPNQGGGTLFTLASDGADFRIDYPNTAPLSSIVLQSGSWSTPVADLSSTMLPTAPQTDFATGACGVWSLTYTDSSAGTYGEEFVAHASGAAAYSPGTLVAPGGFVMNGVASWPGVTDMYWMLPPQGESSPALFVGVGM